MLYRRTEEDMPADKVEIKDALEEGVKIRTLVNPTDFVGIGGKLNSICIMKQKLGQFDSSGRRKAVPSGETYVEEFDIAIPAISQTPDTKFIKGTIQLNGDRVVAGPLYSGNLNARCFCRRRRPPRSQGYCQCGPTRQKCGLRN